MNSRRAFFGSVFGGLAAICGGVLARTREPASSHPDRFRLIAVSSHPVFEYRGNRFIVDQWHIREDLTDDFGTRITVTYSGRMAS